MYLSIYLYCISRYQLTELTELTVDIYTVLQCTQCRLFPEKNKFINQPTIYHLCCMQVPFSVFYLCMRFCTSVGTFLNNRPRRTASLVISRWSRSNDPTSGFNSRVYPAVLKQFKSETFTI